MANTIAGTVAGPFRFEPAGAASGSPDYSGAFPRLYCRRELGYNLAVMLRRLCLTLAMGLLAACSNDPVSSSVGRGRQVFSQHCISCHSVVPDLVIVGPSLNQVAERAGEHGDPRAYLEQSIIDPDAEIVDGYEDLMPSDFGAKLSPEDLQALVDYLMTLE